MDSFSEYQFRQQVEKALTKVKTVLDVNREPSFPADVQHQYTDKYGLAEYLTNTATASNLNVLELLGLNTEKLKKVKEWSNNRSVTIRLKSEERCNFNRETTRKVESATQYVTEVSGFLGGTKTITDKVITTVTEYFWDFEVNYELFLFNGNNINDKVILQNRIGRYEIMTSTKHTPKPVTNIVPSIDCNITWLLQQLNSNLQCQFKIDRTLKSCRTPRRNTQIDSALSFYYDFYRWCGRVDSYYRNNLFPVQTNHGLNLNSLNDDLLFNPVHPLFEDKKGELKESKSESLVSLNSADWPQQPVLTIPDVNLFLSEQKRSVREKFTELAKTFPGPDAKLIGYTEAIIVVAMVHARNLMQGYSNGIEYIEEMLRKQLVAAIGKEVQPVDFVNYMRYHNRKLYRSEYEPKLFSYSIRRPDHYPEGEISIQQHLTDGSISEPILTSVRLVKPSVNMSFNINAACKITFGGERYLHAWLNHEFEGESGLRLEFNARTRQFSSFIVLLGRINSATIFDPKYACILQNKDDLKIPLELETIPSAKEFKDAIESLSPEQQRFAKSYRAMQLESTLFGIVVIQLKPQLEKLLNLPNDSLTKEIQLTENLLEIFIKYQIPSDQLSYDELMHPGCSPAQKVGIVKQNVAEIYKVINGAKKKEIEQKSKEVTYSLLDQIQLGSSLGGGIVKEGSRDIVEAVEYQKKDMKRKMKKSAVSQFKNSAAPGGLPPPKISTSTASITPASNTAVIAKTTTTTTTSAPEQKQVAEAKKEVGLVEVDETALVDYNSIPAQLDSKYEEFDEDGAVRPTIINVGSTWTKKSQKALLANPETNTLNIENQKEEKQKAYDLLDALSRSGSLPIDCAELHVIIAATHCFDKSLVNTIIQDNVNPIEKLERSSLIIATTIQDKEAIQLIKPDAIERITQFSAPALMASAQQDAVVVAQRNIKSLR